LRRAHPAWRLLLADHPPLIISFLYQTLIRPNIRSLSQQEIASKLQAYLFDLQESLGSDAFPRRAQQYLDDWASDDRGWLRKFYPENSDEPHYDVTPASERAIDWLASLTNDNSLTRNRGSWLFLHSCAR
jgi:hypothetical protein